MGQDGAEEEDENTEHQDRPHQSPGREAGRLNHDKFTLGRQPVRDIDCSGKGRDRQNDTDDIRQRKGGKLQKNRGRLTIGDQLVEQHHRAVHPIDKYQHKGEESEQHQKLREKISVESSGHAWAWNTLLGQ